MDKKLIPRNIQKRAPIEIQTKDDGRQFIEKEIQINTNDSNNIKQSYQGSAI
jgi:hypothetical protein